MAEEFLQGGGVCGGSWWNSAPNLFSSSSCSLASNDIGGFCWLKSVGSADDSASAYDGSSSVPVQDLRNSDHWNQDFLSRDREENYSDFRPQINMEASSIDKQSLNSISSSAECAVTTCAGLSAGFLSSSDTYSYGSSLLQTLFDPDSQPQQSLLQNNTIMNSSSPLWNSPAADLNKVPATFLPRLQPQFLPSSISDNQNSKWEERKDLAKKASHEPAFKRPRIETPSPLPTFKVRKEKLGDRITALQQLVSPFGKTDTASVLHEATEYIKFLHDQVNALSIPYMKHGSPPVQQHQQGADKSKDQQVLTKDLKTRGLCLVPISSTIPVASETTTDFWTPTFGGSLR